MTGPPLAVLNDLSLRSTIPEGMSPAQAIVDWLDELVVVLRRLRQVRDDLTLVTPVAPAALIFADAGEALSAVALGHGGRSRDNFRFFVQFLNRSPYSQVRSDHFDERELEAQLEDGTLAVGLGVAAASENLAVSFASADWPAATIAVVIDSYEEDADEIARATRTVRHASTIAHVEEHEDFVRSCAIGPSPSGEEIWSQRDYLFPGLRFLGRVRGDFGAIGTGSGELRQVLIRLRELSAAATSWDPSDSETPKWRSKVTTESASRRDRCDFLDDSGTTYCYEWHARYTPGAGRIYFRLVPQEGLLEIAYVGSKL